MTRDEAPITALMLTVQFAPAIVPPNPLRIADVYTSLKAEFPGFDQLPPAGPMPLNPTSPNALQIQAGPRTRFLTADGQFHVIFQDDRFSFSWNRLAPLDKPSGYPGFSAVWGQAKMVWERLHGRLFNEADSPPEAIVGEIAYTDHFDMARIKHFSEVFTCVSPEFDVNVSALSVAWLEPRTDPGTTQTNIVAPVQTGFQERAIQMQVTSRFPIPDGWTGIGEAFRASHPVALASFERLIASAFRPI